MYSLMNIGKNAEDEIVVVVVVELVSWVLGLILSIYSFTLGRVEEK